MGRTAMVKYEQVASAAEECRSIGRTPTAKLIRQLLGDVGSYGTIQKHLLDWQSSRGEAPATRMLPQELQEAVFRFVDEEGCRINRALRQDLESSKDALRDLAEDSERWFEDADRLRAELVTHSREKAERDGRIARLLDELAATREERNFERHDAERARHELAVAQARLDTLLTLEEEYRKLRAEFEAQREACARAEQNAAVLAAQKAGLEVRLAEIKETDSAKDGARGARDDGHGDKPARTARTATARSKTVLRTKDGPGTSKRKQLDETSAGINEDSEEDPRQCKLC